MSVQVRRNPRGTVTVVRAREGMPRVLGPPELLTLAEAAEVLGRSLEHVERTIRGGFVGSSRS